MAYPSVFFMALGTDHLQTFRYLSPVVFVASALTFSTATACFVPPSRRTVLKPSQRVVSTSSAALVCLLHFLDGILYAYRAVSADHDAVQPDAVTYTTLNFLSWIIIYLVQADAKRVYYLPNLTTWILALFLDVIVSLSSFQSVQAGLYEFVQLSIGLTRIACLVFLCITTIARASRPTSRDSEREPLLSVVRDRSESYPANTLEDGKQYDHEGNEGPSPTDQEKHVETVGGWWAYLHEVGFLLPYLLPLKDRKRIFYALILLVLMISGRFSQLFGPRILGNIVQAISNSDRDDSTLSRQILLYIFAVKLPYDVVIEPARKWMSIRLFWGSYLDLLLCLASHVAGLSYAWHENKQTGEIIAAIGQGQVLNQFVDDFFESTLPLVLDIVAAFAYIAYLFDVYVVLILASTYVFYGIVTYKGTMLCAEARRRYREAYRIEFNALHEAIANWMSTFYLNRHDYQHQRLRSVNSQELAEHLYNYDVTSAMRACQSVVICLGYLGILLRTACLTTLRDNAVGNFVALLFYWNFFTNPLFKLAFFYTSLTQVLVDIERLRQLMQTKPTVLDDDDAPALEYMQGKIEYRDVYFSYHGKNPVIKGLDFTIDPGSTVAIVGRSGSGKTTTCDKLLFRAYDVDAGSILVDGQDIRSVTQESLRNTIGIVRQEPAFNNDTVMENVRYARLGATDDEIIAACKDAAIHDQIMQFPMGYNTVVGERGVKLSGGERQRLAIAQLFLRNPKIVVLDEATSNVDNVAESDIQESFARICKGRTTIIVAHRLSTVQHVDQILVLEQGAVAERGTHHELLAKHGKYYQLWHKASAVKKLKHELKQMECGTPEIQNSEPSDYMNNDSDPEDIIQVDGGTSSKQDDEMRTRMRQRICNLKGKLSRNKFRTHDWHFEEETEDGQQEESVPPIRTLYPQALEACPAPTPRRATQSPRISSHPRKVSLNSPSTSVPQLDIRSISAPMWPVRMGMYGQVKANEPSPTVPQVPSSPASGYSHASVAAQYHSTSTQSRIPVSISPLATPVRIRDSVTQELLLKSPKSPGRKAALGSHPILRVAEEGDVHSEGKEEDNESGTTEHVARTSVRQG